jgi:hypothetical protein
MNWSSELLLLSKELHHKCRRTHGHLTCHERRACWSCLAFSNIDFITLFELHFHIP